MISPNIFNIAKSHSDALLDSIGKVIVPAGRSTLSTLVGLSYVGNVPEGSEVQLADVLAAATEDDIDGPSSHSAVIGARIDALIPVVSAHIDFIQNQVCPDVEKFDRGLQAQVDRLDAVSPVSMFDVVQTNSPEVIDNEDFLGLINKFADHNQPIPALLSSLPAQTAEQLADIMRVSSAAVNEQIGTWLGEMGDDWILGVWNRFFAGMNTTPTGALDGSLYSSFTTIRNLSTFERINTGLALFLLARGLLDNPLDEAGMTLQEWRADMDAISRFAGAEVKSGLYLLDMVKNQSVVILGTVNGGKRIMVYAPTYATYLEEGGCLEEILGAALSQSASTYTLETMKSEGKRYGEIWSNFQATGQSTLNARAVSTLQAEARALFSQACSITDTDEDLALQAVYGKSYALQKQADSIIETMELKQLRDTRQVALCLIAGLRYAHTPAKQFLEDMHAAEQAGCKSPQEAALVAAGNYVSDALACELALAVA